MDTLLKICYPMGHETPWHPRYIGKAKASSHSLARIRPELPLRGRESGRLFKFRGALASGLQEEGARGTSSQADARTPGVVVPKAKEKARRPSGRRASGCWLPHGSVDSKTDRIGDRQALWDTLLHRQLLEADGCPGLELPEAREKGPGAKRSSHPLLEAPRVAAYKKRPKGLEPIWSSWMSLDFFWFLPSPEHGRPEDRRHFFPSPAAGARSRPSRRLQSPQRGGGWLSISASSVTKTSAPLRWPNSCGTCCAISVARWFCCGTAVGFTGQSSFGNSCTAISGPIPIPSQAMPRSLIRTNSSGHSSKEPSPTVSQGTWCILSSSFKSHSAGFSALSSCCGLVFTHQIYHGHNPRIHYLVESQ